MPAQLHPPLNWKDCVGIAVWTTGFIIEVVADHQKTQWRKDRDEKRHSDEWITRGLWGKSRHPNYFGMLLPTGVVNKRRMYNMDWRVSCLGAYS